MHKKRNDKWISNWTSEGTVVFSVLLCEQYSDILTSKWLLYSGGLSMCVHFYVCSAVTFWPVIDFFVRRSLRELYPPGGDRIGHTEWMTFHLLAPPQWPQVVPLCHWNEGRWVFFIWKIGPWVVKEDYLRATLQAELICISEHEWGDFQDFEVFKFLVKGINFAQIV